MSEFDNMTPEQLRQAADNLAQKQRAEIAEKLRLRIIQANLKTAELLIAELKKNNILARVEEDRVCGHRLRIESDPSFTCSITPRYESYGRHYIGLCVKLGCYGERPHTYDAATPEEFNYDKIVKSIVKRLAARFAAHQAEERQHQIDQKRQEIRKSNEIHAKKFVLDQSYGYVTPSSTEGKAVTVTLRASFDLTEAQAERFFKFFTEAVKK